MPGKHVIIEGIDGSGKSTIRDALREDAVASGKRILDVPAVWRDTGDYPTGEMIAAADVVFTAEPSTVWVGKAIRAELIRTGAGYSAWSAAMAFSLDREIHYRKVVLPARTAGKTVIQDRCVATSIVYQPVQAEPIPIEDVLRLPGNALALEHSPDLLLIATLSVDTALARLAARHGKNDNAVFERRALLETFAERYAAPWFRALFTDRGTQIIELSTEGAIAEVRQRARELVKPFLT